MSVKRTKKQLAWMQLYEDQTGCDAAIRLRELEEGKIGFAEFAQANIKYYEVRTQGVVTEISRDVPE